MARVAEFIKSNPSINYNRSQFVEGWGWDHTQWPLERWPTSVRLTTVNPGYANTNMQQEMEKNPTVRGRPIVLQSKDGHALWVSKKILDAMIPIPDHVDGGAIIRDEDGNPSGSQYFCGVKASS